MDKPIIILVCFLLITLGCQSPRQNKPIDLIELTITEIQKAYVEGTFTSEQVVTCKHKTENNEQTIKP